MPARELAYIAMGATIISVCSWITLPLPVPFTMQTFAVFAVLLYLGGKKGGMAILVYILLGAAGLPVFSGFGAGIAVLLGPTGGYIWGFLLIAGINMLLEKKVKTQRRKLLVLAAGLFLCYIAGTLQFYSYMSIKGGSMSFFKCLSLCVFPFILPDMLKLTLAFAAVKRLKKGQKRD